MKKLTMPEVRVTLGDETEHTVQTIQADAIRWDMTRVKHGWPAVDEHGANAMLWLSFIAWHALHRTGATEQTWETFSNTVLEVTSVRDAAVDPTQPGHTPG